MFLLRKIGSVFRGKATPLQVMFATLLGGMLGFVPGFFLRGDLGGGFAQAPGLILLLLCAVLVLNANLGVFGLVTLVAKALSLALVPVSYSVGTFLVDGPLQGLFRWLVNARVTAWFGFEYYATVGGLCIGTVFGLVAGLVMNRTIRAIRTRMANVEENSDGYQKFAGKWWVRFASWLLLGKGKGKQSWRDLAEQTKVGLPIRISGILVAGVAVASLWVFQQWFSTPILTQNLRAGLEAMNGATVDLERATLDLSSGEIGVHRLAIADSRALDKDLLAADQLVAIVDTGELLRRRFVIDEVRSTTARGGTPRSTPGVRIPRAEEPAPPPPPPPAGTKTVDDWVKDFESYQQRFEQIREWIDVLTGGDKAPSAETPTPEQEAEREAERKKQEETVGYVRVRAEHLLEQTPRVLIRKIDIEGIGYSIGGKVDTLDLRVRNASDRPSIVAEPLSVQVTSQSGKLENAKLSGKSAAESRVGFEFALRDLAVDDIFGKLKISGAPPVRGGSMAIATSGFVGKTKAQGTTIDLPLRVTMKDTTFALAGAKETKIDSLVVPVGLRGPVSRPAVELDDKALQDALVAAGQKELANFVQGQAGKLLGGLPKELQGVVDPTKKPTEIVDEAKKKAEEEAKRLEEEAKKKALEEAKKKLPGGLQGILPGGGKK